MENIELFRNERHNNKMVILVGCVAVDMGSRVYT